MMRERFERIERAYFAALDGRYPETVPPSIWRQAILDAVSPPKRLFRCSVGGCVRSPAATDPLSGPWTWLNH